MGGEAVRVHARKGGHMSEPSEALAMIECEDRATWRGGK